MEPCTLHPLTNAPKRYPDRMSFSAFAMDRYFEIGRELKDIEQKNHSIEQQDDYLISLLQDSLHGSHYYLFVSLLKKIGRSTVVVVVCCNQDSSGRYECLQLFEKPRVGFNDGAMKLDILECLHWFSDKRMMVVQLYWLVY